MMAEECGCKVIVVGGLFGEEPAYGIIYCPRHAAADAMYEALRMLIASQLSVGWIKAQAALALADGE